MRVVYLEEKMKRHNKKWLYSEIKYLKNNWGEISITSMARHLGRKPCAIQRKAGRIGLKRSTDYGEYITFHQLILILNKTSYDKYNKKLLNAGFPLKYIKLITKKIKVVYMTDFWKWLEKNKHILDLSYTEKGDLGFEPDWVEIKRQADKRAAEYIKTKWTEEEDNKLKQLLNTFNYGYREISIKLKRTEGAIKRRMRDLNILQRPLKADNHNLWKSEEIATVKDLYLKGFKSQIIAEYVNRSALAINGLLERHNYFNCSVTEF